MEAFKSIGEVLSNFSITDYLMGRLNLADVVGNVLETFDKRMLESATKLETERETALKKRGQRDEAWSDEMKDRKKTYQDAEEALLNRAHEAEKASGGFKAGPAPVAGSFDAVALAAAQGKGSEALAMTLGKLDSTMSAVLAHYAPQKAAPAARGGTVKVKVKADKGLSAKVEADAQRDAARKGVGLEGG